MKLKKGFVLRKVAGMTVVTATDSTCDFDGMITLNESAELMWNRLILGATISDLADILLSEYDVDKQTAINDAYDFVKILKENGILDESTN